MITVATQGLCTVMLCSGVRTWLIAGFWHRPQATSVYACFCKQSSWSSATPAGMHIPCLWLLPEHGYPHLSPESPWSENIYSPAIPRKIQNPYSRDTANHLCGWGFSSWALMTITVQHLVRPNVTVKSRCNSQKYSMEHGNAVSRWVHYEENGHTASCKVGIPRFQHCLQASE